jgi:hypothetical protein
MEPKSDSRRGRQPRIPLLEVVCNRRKTTKAYHGLSRVKFLFARVFLRAFGHERLTGALLDLITHYFQIPEMSGESYRLSP